MSTEITKHPETERCFYCATDNELNNALGGREHATIRMDLPVEACPFESAFIDPWAPSATAGGSDV